MVSPLYKLYRYVQLQRVLFLRGFDVKYTMNVEHFDLK